MLLPKQISPNPVASASLELRFKSQKLTADNLVEVFYPFFSPEFPKVTPNIAPKDEKNPSAIDFSPHYFFANEEFSVGVAPEAVTINSINGYHLWGSFFNVIKENLTLLNSRGIIDSLGRVGLRYINLFEGKAGLNEHLKINSGFQREGYTERTQASTTLYVKGEIRLSLQLIGDAILTSATTGKSMRGLLIDIDCAIMELAGMIIDETVLNKIESLHKEEKQLFYSILKEDFLSSLNPVYND